MNAIFRKMTRNWLQKFRSSPSHSRICGHVCDLLPPSSISSPHQFQPPFLRKDTKVKKVAATQLPSVFHLVPGEFLPCSMSELQCCLLPEVIHSKTHTSPTFSILLFYVLTILCMYIIFIRVFLMCKNYWHTNLSYSTITTHSHLTRLEAIGEKKLAFVCSESLTCY